MVEAVLGRNEQEMKVLKASIVEWFEVSAVEKRKKGVALGEGTDSGEPSRVRARAFDDLEKEIPLEATTKPAGKGQGTEEVKYDSS